jgi:hypothetical protein
MSRSRLAVPDLAGWCAVCMITVPATPAAEPCEGKARLVVHDHPNPDLGPCIGSRMVTWAIGQLPLFGADEIRRAA